MSSTAIFANSRDGSYYKQSEGTLSNSTGAISVGYNINDTSCDTAWSAQSGSVS